MPNSIRNHAVWTAQSNDFTVQLGYFYAIRQLPVKIKRSEWASSEITSPECMMFHEANNCSFLFIFSCVPWMCKLKFHNELRMGLKKYCELAVGNCVYSENDMKSYFLWRSDNGRRRLLHSWLVLSYCGRRLLMFAMYIARPHFNAISTAKNLIRKLH